MPYRSREAARGDRCEDMSGVGDGEADSSGGAGPVTERSGVGAISVGEVGEAATASDEAAGPVTMRWREGPDDGNPRPMEGVRPRPATQWEMTLGALGLVPGLPSAKGRGGTGSVSLWDVPKKASVLELAESAGLTDPSF